MSDQNNTHYTTISCVYDLLQNEESSCKWSNNGDITINRPNVNVNLESIKFRSFSANIKANIQNLSSPNINAKMYGMFQWFKNQSQALPDVSGLTKPSSDYVTGTEIAINPYISNLSLSIYNQTGTQTYEPANGIYDNNINNEIILKEFNVPLITSFQDSVDDMLNYAKYNFMKLFGLFYKKDTYDEMYGHNLYNCSNFVNGIKTPYIKFISNNNGYVWNNGPHYVTSSFIDILSPPYTKGCKFNTYGLSVSRNVLGVNGNFINSSNNPLTFWGKYILNYKNSLDYTDNEYKTYEKTNNVPYGAFKIWSKFRGENKEDKCYIMPSVLPSSSQTPISFIPYNKPWVQPGKQSPEGLCSINDMSLIGMHEEYPKLKLDDGGFLSIGGVMQNGNYYCYTTYCMHDMNDKLKSIGDLKERRHAKYLLNDNLEYGANAYISLHFNNVDGYHIVNFTTLATNNKDAYIANFGDEDFYYLTSFVVSYGDADWGPNMKYILYVCFISTNKLRVAKFKIDGIDGLHVYPDSESMNSFPKWNLDYFEFNKEFKCIVDDWNESNYMEYVQEMENSVPPNVPMLILPKYTDTTNDFLNFYLDMLNGSVIFGSNTSITLKDNNKEDPTIPENYFYSNRTLFSLRYKMNDDGQTFSSFEISTFGPLNNVAENGKLLYKITIEDTQFFNNFMKKTWWAKRYSLYGLNLTDEVNKYADKIKMPIYNALIQKDYPIDYIGKDSTGLTITNDTDLILCLYDAEGNELNLQNRQYKKNYLFAQSALCLSFNYTNPTDLKTTNYKLYPAVPAINESGIYDDNHYSWAKPQFSYIKETFANPYYWSDDAEHPFLNEVFSVDNNGNINFPCIPFVSKDGSTSGLFTILLKFDTDPAIFSFDPSIKQSNRFADRYNVFKQYINKTPSLINEKFPFDDYIYYNNNEIYNNMVAYLELKNRDLTLKLKCQSYPSINNIVFHLNETSMVDFKECQLSRGTDKISFFIIDADNVILTPDLAKKIYSNINICVDWTFSN